MKSPNVLRRQALKLGCGRYHAPDEAEFRRVVERVGADGDGRRSGAASRWRVPGSPARRHVVERAVVLVAVEDAHGRVPPLLVGGQRLDLGGDELDARRR